MGLTPGSGRSPGKGNGNPLQHACLENPWIEGPGGLQSIEYQRLETMTKNSNKKNNLNHIKQSTFNYSIETYLIVHILMHPGALLTPI